ncbi:MAG: hypothetical protein A2Y60_01835 [Chloroflexi bacterium RBG_13_54_9]|nr:MAG: hypothetical protein A2Y60_01835 [Chloroflexi bacterium RBG_13_54_9]
MSDIRTRLSRLENITPERERKTWVIVQGEPEPDAGPNDRVIIALDEETRQLTLRLIAGEGT